MQKTLTYQALRIERTQRKEVDDVLTVEHPLSIRINGEPFTLTMQTPGDELDLTRGLLYTEGVVKLRSGEVPMHVAERDRDGRISAIDVVVDDEQLQASQFNKRSLLSVASCGICGKTELTLPEGRLTADQEALSVAQIDSMFSIMHAGQSAFRSSGGCHGAAIFDGDHRRLVLREDIGRHNAVDKCIGALLTAGQLNSAKYALVSGRVSYEIVVKCFTAGIPNLLAVSAPSSLAVDFCKELGITLYGFCREGRATCYNHG